ncbi:MAG: hypothetical protein K6A30_06380 [Lachnospiraceae bacterium]|nr:hypothetical protein [Lachnospiraceae bacterium]
MRLHEVLSGTDKFKLFFVELFTIISAGVLYIKYENGIDRLILGFFLTILFFLVLLFRINYEYTIEESQHHIHEDVDKMLKTYGLAIVITTAGYFLPVPVHFLLSMTALVCAFLPLQYGLSLTLMMAISIGINVQSTNFELVFLVFSCLVGAMFSKMAIQRRYFFYVAMMLMAVSSCSAMILSYAVNGQLETRGLAYGFVEGIANAVMILAVIPFCVEKEQEQTIIFSSYAEAMEEDFPLSLFMQSISEERYERNLIVAKSCRKCAQILQLNSDLCCCAGFYYDLCNNDEEDPVEYASILARQNFLPMDVVHILSQYNGLNRDIDTKEGALVDLIHESMYELWNKHADEKNSFEKEVVIHTMFNDLSRSGRYDHSGLSMNEFLILRENLIREVTSE